MSIPASASFPWSQIPEPPAGEARAGALPSGAGYIAARGSRPGPALLVVAGPGSLSAILGLFRLARALDAHRLGGSLLALPFASGAERDQALTGGEMAGVSDALVLVEGPGDHWVCAGHVACVRTGDRALDERAEALAAAFGGAYRLARTLPGSGTNLVAGMARDGKPAVRAVAPDEPANREERAEACFLGLINVLRALGMLEGRMTDSESVPVEPLGAARSPVDGFWAPAVRVGQHVRANDTLGSLWDRQGGELGGLVSNVAGTVLGFSTVVWARGGEPLVDLVRPVG